MFHLLQNRALRYWFRTAALAGWLALLGASAAQAVNFEWGRVSPYAVFAEDIASSTITVQAKVSNTPARVVARYFGNWFSAGSEPLQTVQLYDDATNGDQTAGDGIFTGQFVFSGAVPRLRRYGGQLDHLWIVIQAEDSAGTFVPFASTVDPQLELGLVAGKNRIEPVTLGSTIQASDAAVSIVDAAYFTDQSERRVMQTFYSAFPDNFDGFAIFSGGRTIGDGIGRAGPVRNEVSGIGVGPSDTSAEYGSGGKLKYFIRANKEINGDDFLHLFGHSFGVYLTRPELDLTANGGLGIHWGITDMIGQMVGGPYLRSNPGGTFTIEGSLTYAHNRYSDLELYLMGLMGPEQVGPHRFVLSSPAPAVGSTIGADAIRVVRIDDVVSVYGTRTPAAGTAQKDFAFAFIVVSDRFATTAELTYINTFARYYASRATGGTLAGGGLFPTPDPPSFAAATNFAGTLTTSVYRFDTLTQDRIFNWAEGLFAGVFSPPATSQNIAGFRARAYPNGIYLATMNDRVYIFGPPWGGLVDVGRVADFLPLVIQGSY